MKGGELPVPGGVQVGSGPRAEPRLVPARGPQSLPQAPFRLQRRPRQRRERGAAGAGRGLLFRSGERSPRREAGEGAPAPPSSLPPAGPAARSHHEHRRLPHLQPPGEDDVQRQGLQVRPAARPPALRLPPKPGPSSSPVAPAHPPRACSPCPSPRVKLHPSHDPPPRCSPRRSPALSAVPASSPTVRASTPASAPGRSPGSAPLHPSSAFPPPVLSPRLSPWLLRPGPPTSAHGEAPSPSSGIPAPASSLH